MDLYELMEKELGMLNANVRIFDVPEEMVPTRESLEKLNERMAITISNNENKALRSYEIASRFALD